MQRINRIMGIDIRDGIKIFFEDVFRITKELQLKDSYERLTLEKAIS